MTFTSFICGMFFKHSTCLCGMCLSRIVVTNTIAISWPSAHVNYTHNRKALGLRGASPSTRSPIPLCSRSRSNVNLTHIHIRFLESMGAISILFQDTTILFTVFVLREWDLQLAIRPTDFNGNWHCLCQCKNTG